MGTTLQYEVRPRRCPGGEYALLLPTKTDVYFSRIRFAKRLLPTR